ncbi:MAG: hypothetical protein ACI4VR_02975 [Bacilli bacterium]
MAVIYFISGKARHGKDTVGLYLKEFYEMDNKKVITCAYANYLKEYAKKISDWDGNEDTKPRGLLQKLGSVIREELNLGDMLTDRLNYDILIYSKFADVIIVTDVRLKKEIEAIKRNFPNSISINVNRINFDNGLTLEQKNNITEIDLDDYDEYDYKIINTTLPLLKSQVKEIYEEVNNNEIHE